MEGNGDACWCPIVVKNRDALISWLGGYNFMRDFAESIFEVKLGNIRLPISSNRFNDIMPNGRRLGKMSKKEQQDYLNQVVDQKVDQMNDEVHKSEMNVMDPVFLDIECPKCGIPYIFDTSDDIPHVNFNCNTCGALIIQYTGHDDEEYLFDG